MGRPPLHHRDRLEARAAAAAFDQDLLLALEGLIIPLHLEGRIFMSADQDNQVGRAGPGRGSCRRR
ncbi:MAG TPA: hypothetical protein VFZ66_15425 [Herpetosiphonaceae bacterium]